ncbi:hypothetical protein [Verrucomicrobium spinosum]|uniref:hypothetical protein n=2 Tax=Verrucomicrobium spinosum TaxID=2736 RepID=UPI0004924532|nr:hypothetical protein [Verrucomicrobium spinosum]
MELLLASTEPQSHGRGRMFRAPSFLPLRESRVLIVVSALLFTGFLTAYLTIDRPVKQERRIERLKAEGKVVAPEAYVPVWLYKGLKLNLGLSALLLLASPWLGRRHRDGMALMEAPTRPPWTKWHTLGLVGVVGLGAWMNSPRLTLSMWGDEDFNASRFILDKVERQPDGTLTIEPRSWATTLWNMRKPTNHLGYSAFARLTHETFFRPGTGPDAPWFNEALLRAPVFVGGLATLALMIWSLRVWGLGGWWTALLMAAHPWFIRFAVDGRGYGFVMLGATALVGVVGRALHTGLWRWWVLMGLLEFFILWSNFQSVYLLAGFNLLVIGALCSPTLTWPARLLLASRWVVGGLVTCFLVLGYLTPCWPQMLEFMKKGEIHGTMDLRWWQDSFSGWVFGQPWNAWSREANPLHHHLSAAFAAHPVLFAAGTGTFLLTLVVGVWALVTDRTRRLLLIFVLAPPLLMLAHMAAGQNKPYPWYLLPFLPGLLMLVSAAASGMARWRVKHRHGLLLAVTTLFVLITAVPRDRMRHHPIEPSRESVASYRKIMSPRHPDFDKEVMGGALSMFTEAYDPAMYRADNLTEFRAVLAEADRSGRQLYFNLGDVGFHKANPTLAEVIAILEDPAQFEHVGHFSGLMPFTSRDVFRYRRGDRDR